MTDGGCSHSTGKYQFHPKSGTFWHSYSVTTLQRSEAETMPKNRRQRFYVGTGSLPTAMGAGSAQGDYQIQTMGTRSARPKVAVSAYLVTDVPFDEKR